LVTYTYAAITPAAVANAYDAPTNLDGTGQTIAIIGDSIPARVI
jgi:subtilase family serine protease